MYESSSGSSYKLKIIHIDPNHKPIDVIQVKINGDSYLYGLRLIDIDDEMICDETWATGTNSGTWMTKEVEEG